MATAMRVLDEGVGQLAGSQEACRLMEKGAAGEPPATHDGARTAA